MPIIDDNVFEDTESFTLNIEAIDVDRVRVDEERSQKVLYIEDNDGNGNIWLMAYVRWIHNSHYIANKVGLAS